MTECVVAIALAAVACVSPLPGAGAGHTAAPSWERLEQVEQVVHRWPRTADVIDLDQQLRRWVREQEQGWRGVARLR